MGVTVFTKDNCPQCRMVKKLLTEQGIPFEERHDIEWLKEQGFTTVPVTVHPYGEPIIGFRPDLLKELKDVD